MIQMQAATQRLTKLAELLDAKTIKPIVSTVLPLAQSAEAWKLSKSGHTRGKIVLEVP